MPDYLERLLSKDYVASIRAKIPDSGATPPCQVYSCGTTTSNGTVRALTQQGFIFDKQPLTWGSSESILVDPTTNMFYGTNDKRTPAGAALGY